MFIRIVLFVVVFSIEEFVSLSSATSHSLLHNHYFGAKNTNKTINDGDNDIFSLWNKFPTHIMMNTTNLSDNCRNAMDEFSSRLKDNDLDALKMFDASAKAPSGLLSGNANQYGDFDECLSAKRAQYCLAEIDLRPVWKKPFSDYKHLVHSHFAIKDEFGDPKHRVPGFTMIKWGICLPSECTINDLENAIEEKTGARAHVDQNLCQNGGNSNAIGWDFGDYIARSFFILVILAVIISTLFVYNNNNNTTLLANENRLKRIFVAFSLQNSLRSFQKTDLNKTDNQIRAVHGIRALSALALLMSHKTMALLYNPYINRTLMAEHFGMSWAVLGRTAIVYTDSFMFLSGLLNANALLNCLKKDNTMKFKEKFISRLFRITPNIVAVILFCTYLLPYLGSGPLWPLVIGHHSKLCKKFMWRNFLYVHNYFGFENMCLTHTHQVGIDMQLFIVTPLVVFVLWKNKQAGFGLIAFLGLTSTLLRIWATWTNDLSHMVHFGITISRMFKTADFSYILPTHRATIYLMGVYMAYILKFSNSVYITKKKYVLYWILALIIGLSPMFGPFHMAKQNYSYNKTDAVVYAALAPIFWALGLSWVIYVDNRNQGGWFGSFLSWKGFEYFARISYAVYLVQFPVFFYNVGITRHVDQFRLNFMLPLAEVFVVLGVSIILTLFIELPFQNLHKIIFNDKSEFNAKISGNKTDVTRDKKMG